MHEFENLKTLLVQKPPHKIFPEKIIQVKKSEKLHPLIFHQTWITSTWAHFESFLA